MSLRRAALSLLFPLTFIAACGSDKAAAPGTTPVAATTPANSTAPAGSTATSAPATTAASPTAIAAVEAGAAFPADRCEANKAAGTITYLTGFDYAASASIVDVLVAQQKGYYKDLCLDVKITSSTADKNYAIIAANEAQFASGGSFSEVVNFAGANDAGFVALAVEGRTGIAALITKDGQVPTLAALKGNKIGVQFVITPEVKAMLAAAGLIEGTDYETVALSSFDPKANIEIPDIVGFAGYKSNEPKQLEAAGVPFKLYDPSESDVPGSFGVLYTNSAFLDEFPTASEDFMRATMLGLADAIADPATAVKLSIELATAGGNPYFLSEEGEKARWAVESKMVSDRVTSTAPAGVILVDNLDNEVTTYAKIGLFDGKVPDITSMFNADLVKGLYDTGGKVIWPSK
jgi:ABC-type nitrate/sulfonate/bicarbonate transport system substrate-binding protein